jgi:hypothetical protein
MLAGVLAGCVRRDGVNAACEWPAEMPSPLHPRNAAHQQHLIEDAHFAEELGIRHGDSFRGSETVPERDHRVEECTNRLLGMLARLHAVTSEDVARARASRNWRWDVVTVFAPMLLLFAVASGAAIDRVRRRFSADEKTTAGIAIAVLSIGVAALGLAAGELWSWLVEILRVGDSHLSYRASRMPWVRYRLPIYVTGVVVVWIVAWLAYRVDSGDPE